MGFRNRRRRVISTALVAATLMASAPAAGAPTLDASGAAVMEQAERRPNTASMPSLLVSDSAWLGIYLYGGGIDAVQGFEHTLSLAQCRRRIARSCRNSAGTKPTTLLQELEAHGSGFGTLIVSTGHNDDDGAFRAEVHVIITRARELGYERVVWVTLRSAPNARYATEFRNSNAALADIVASNRYPELHVADWASYARDRPQWFGSDGVHLRPVGSYAAADYISRKMAHLNQQPCPQPFVWGGPVPSPCPDPDLQGPFVVIDSVYPIHRPHPGVPFRVEYEGSSSWPAPPWWQS